MNFIKFKTTSKEDEELINLDLIVNIYKEDRDNDWRECFGIKFSSDETMFEAYYEKESERNKYFDDLVKKITLL